MRCFFICAMLVATSANAAVYKCKDASGNWSEAACTGAAAPPPKTERREKLGPGEFAPYCPTGESASEAVANACLDEYRNLLNDPRSAYLVGNEIRKQIKSGELRLLLDARAKNKFGAFIPLRAACTLSADGAIDRAGTKSERELWSAFQALGLYDPESLVTTKGCP